MRSSLQRGRTTSRPWGYPFPAGATIYRDVSPCVRLQLQLRPLHRPDGITCCSPLSSLGTIILKPLFSFIWTFDATVFGEVPGYDRMLFTI
ncbi:hypothetical protein AB205_0143290 [Aquarana catesbeiana]|uniref:Uncharacterized protein n=1 Tax=Aquarana catesbeiana TaxID=8400 RepID=A0A2G9QEB8_AQUCT|nr:hypothetical protein AB205_0143290 [Aquarana catesbeiana]